MSIVIARRHLGPIVIVWMFERVTPRSKSTFLRILSTLGSLTASRLTPRLPGSNLPLLRAQCFCLF